MYQEIDYRVSGAAARITFNRPDRLNALTLRMLSELRHAVAAAEQDPAVVGIILTGAGRGFSAGMDTSALQAVIASGRSSLGAPPAELEANPGDPAMGPEFRVSFAWLLTVTKPVIAAINGACAGLSLAIATLCDLRFAGASAVFRVAFAQRGLVAEHGLSWTLPRLIGPSRALDLLWHPRKVDAAEALQMGLVNRVIDDSALMATALEYIETVAGASSPASLREMKQQVYRGLMQNLDEAMLEALRRMEASFHRPDFAEGVASFMEQRPPHFPRLA